jgi:hypothetical protein
MSDNNSNYFEDIDNIPEYLQNEYILNGLKGNIISIHNIPKKYINAKLILKICELYHIMIISIKKHLFGVGEDMLMEVLAENPMIIQTMPLCYITEKMCQFAVSKNGRALSGVPPIFKTEELCLLAVRQDYNNIADVPHEMRYSRRFKRLSQQY